MTGEWKALIAIWIYHLFLLEHSISKGDKTIPFIHNFVDEFPPQRVFVLQETEMELGHR